MSFGSRHNRQNPFKIDTEGYTYKKLADFSAGTTFKIDGVYINRKGNYGPTPAAIVCSEKIIINLPQHRLTEVEGILTNDEDIEDIKAGRAAIEIYSYKDDNGKDRLSAAFIDA